MPISRSNRPCPDRRRRGKTSPWLRRQGKPIVCITMGYPAGIGPEIIIKALASPRIEGLANFLILGDEFVFKKAANLIRKRLSYQVIKPQTKINFSKKRILFLDLENVPHSGFHFGRVSESYGRASIEYIKEAVSLIRQKKADLLVTAPIHKHAAELSGFKYPGHTEYLARLFGTKDYAMMLIGGGLKVILVTTHLPIKEVSHRLKREEIVNLLGLTDRSLKRYFGIVRPRIAVCGLNPHAGEGGTLGDEEKRIIAPAIEKARKKRIDVYGPIAADVVFYQMYKGDYHAAICMYHDQGLVALKMLARDESVNITLGLPFIRTSPGHGTALDIAAEGIASPESMAEAIKTAVGMYNSCKL